MSPSLLPYMIVDLHTHTNASDGSLSPVELLSRAQAAGVQCLAITDHDTVAGHLAAAAYYTQNCSEMCLLSGIEFSCRWAATTVHVLGLGMDCDHSAMVAGISRLGQARLDRAEQIADRLASRGFAGALGGAKKVAGSSQLGRPHFATWMVSQGHARDIEDAFSKYLGAGKLGDVKAYWPELAEVVQWVRSAGGIAVVAHPLKYKFTRSKLRRLLTHFVDCGGEGLEVISGRQGEQERQELIGLACSFDLAVSAGSDFHRDSDYGPRIGVDVGFMHALDTVWKRLDERRLTMAGQVA